jgi:hypothetical protein
MSEKKEQQQLEVEVKDVVDSSRSSLRLDQPSFDEKRTKNLLWKLDRNIVPFLSLLYL